MRYKRIRNLREDNDFTQAEIAEYLCVKQSTYSDYENGKINIPIEAFIKLADFYRTSVDYLTNRTNEKGFVSECSFHLPVDCTEEIEVSMSKF